ncbi:MAG: IS66 family transposase zinc-finger binding domain-containing protein [Chloroflexota bacterium]
MPKLTEMNTEALREFAVGLLGQLAQKDETIKIKQLKIDQLTHEMGILKRWRFGRRSEQLESGQRSLLEESIDEDIEAIGVEVEALQEPAADRQQKDKPRRTALPGHLPRREVRHEPEQTQCSCGCILERIVEDVSEKLDYTPGVFEVERHIRGKWVCRRCERLIQAPVPPQVKGKEAQHETGGCSVYERAVQDDRDVDYPMAEDRVQEADPRNSGQEERYGHGDRRTQKWRVV